MIVQQLKELEKLGPKMKGIGDCPISTDRICFALTQRGEPTLTSHAIRQGSFAVARRRQPRPVG